MIPESPSLPTILAWDRLQAGLEEDRQRYRAHGEAPHGVLDGFLDQAWLASTDTPRELRALGQSGAIEEYRSYNTRSAATAGQEGLPMPIRALVAELHGRPFVAYLEQLTGIAGLVPDVDLDNGGIHYMKPGGFVRLHRDELIHPFLPNLRRRLNLLVYLNEDWSDAWGGHLELWSHDGQRCLDRIAPRFNRCVVTTIDSNVHGIPEPVACPEGEARTTLALWYYTDERSAVKFQPAVFVSKPGDGLSRRALIRLESELFGAYHRVKRSFRTANRAALSLMRLVGYGRVPRG